jgi:hypothetical protein
LLQQLETDPTSPVAVTTLMASTTTNHAHHFGQPEKVYSPDQRGMVTEKQEQSRDLLCWQPRTISGGNSVKVCLPCMIYSHSLYEALAFMQQIIKHTNFGL